MAKVSFVPYDAAYLDLFAFCEIDLPTQDFNGQEGWELSQFQNALTEARERLDERWDTEDPDVLQGYFDFLDTHPYNILFWSTEAPYIDPGQG